MEISLSRSHNIKYLRAGLTVLVVFFLAIYMPMHLIDERVDTPLLKGLYSLCIILLVLDFVYNLRNYRKKEQRIGWPRSKNSIWSLIIDGFVCIPFLIIGSAWYIQVAQLLKAYSVNRYILHVKQFDVKYDRSLSLVLFVFWLVAMVHWISCGWLAIRGMDDALDLSTNYITSLYWTITTLTSVGYGDITPDGNMEMLYAMLVQLIGVAGLGYLIANVVSVISKKDHVETRYIDQVDRLSTTLKRRKIPQEVQARILNYYAYMRNERVGYDESQFLETLPRGLKDEVALLLRKEFIEKIPLFDMSTDNFIADVALCMELIVASPGDTIIRRGDAGDEMFLIVHGNVEVLNQDDSSQLTILKEGDYFGEIALIEESKRTATVKALDFCNLYVLKKETFDQVLTRYPEIAEVVIKKAKDRGEMYK